MLESGQGPSLVGMYEGNEKRLKKERWLKLRNHVNEYSVDYDY